MYPHLSKAEMLLQLARAGFNVPRPVFFSRALWLKNQRQCLDLIGQAGLSSLLAVRSSSLGEDGEDSSMAGAFHSLLNVPGQWPENLAGAIQEVAGALPSDDDQILIQPMVQNVSMSGVLMTRGLDDGAPYYVINYDDSSGRTDTVTSGQGVHKTVHIHRGVKAGDFDSPRLLAVVELARQLESLFGGEPLDIEFAVDRSLQVHLLQVRRICSLKHWSADVERSVDAHIGHVSEFVEQLMSRRRGLWGEKTILGVMPDWNPAEMIGVHPKPLALSLYRELITRRAFARAREAMGYRAMPPAELMVAVAGRPYIDVRVSFNSFLPENLPEPICEKLLAAWLQRLDENPAFHDKVEFEVVHTVAEPDFEENFRARYGDILSPSELTEYRVRLRDLTAKAMFLGGSLASALGEIEKLKAIQDSRLELERREAPGLAPFDLALRISEALEECRALGTTPFAVAARHGFIAETWLRALARRGALSPGRVEALKRSVKTISGELTRDFHEVLRGHMPRPAFLSLYGHLRPGAYDITSPSYRERHDLFDVSAENVSAAHETFENFRFSENERPAVEAVLSECGLGQGAEAFLEYVRRSVAGREYAKFIFTRHLDHILFLIAAWGEKYGFSRDEMAFLSIDDLLAAAFQPLTLSGPEHFSGRIEGARLEYALGRSFKLSYLIRSPRDVYIVPQHRSEPNFIGRSAVEAPVLHLSVNAESAQSLEGRLVCIESADPGYDWIFTRNIAGLITRYGGANSHMAIRCAEYGLPAAIGCGERLFEIAASAETLRLDCAARTLTALARPLPRAHMERAARHGSAL